jgi:hypothetical protein
MAAYCEHSGIPSGSIKGGDFFDSKRDSQLPEEDCSMKLVQKLSTSSSFSFETFQMLVHLSSSCDL